MEILYAGSSDLQFDVLCLTETWLDDSVLNSEILSASYCITRSDRKFSQTHLCKGGGVLIATNKNKIKCVDVSVSLLDCYVKIDVAACKIFFCNVCIYIMCIYIPPDILSGDFESFFDSLEQVCINFGESSKLIVVGDFNVNKFATNDYNNQKVAALNKFMSFVNMSQNNFTRNAHNRLLDLCFVRDLSVNVVEDIDPIIAPDSHHPALNIELDTNYSKPSKVPFRSSDKAYNFKRADFIALYTDVALLDWSLLQSIENANDACDYFYKMLYSILDRHVPKYKNNRNTFPRWYSIELKRSIKLKNYFFQKAKKCRDGFYKSQFCITRSTCKRLLHRDYKTYINNVQCSIVNNPKFFWKFIKEKRNQSIIPTEILHNDSLISDGSEIVSLFKEHFASVYSSRSSNININLINQNPQSSSNHFIINIDTITNDDIRNAIKTIKANFNSGIDGIPAFLIKDCASILIQPLHIIFNKCIQQSTFPDVWKNGRVYPLHKGGDKHDLKNYRPISISCNFAKILESIIYKYIYPSISNDISIHQHGFMQNRSTVTNLMTITQFLCENLDSSKQVDVIYTDISKAFDKVDHEILILKLEQFGFSRSLLLFFKSYLQNRIHTINCNGLYSEPFIQSSGVPQGSNLGPLLFLIYINDIGHVLTHSHYELFADDLKIFRTIHSIDDCSYLQCDLDNINKWCECNGLQLNKSKCSVLSYTRKLNIIDFNYQVQSTKVDRKTTIKDLGIIFDQKLSFNEHIDGVVNSAYKTLGFVIRNSKSFDNVTATKCLYFSLVRSKLEYCSQIWNPFYKKQSQQLENIQRKFYKYLYYKQFNEYPQQGLDQGYLLNLFHADSLNLRRYVSSILFLVKLLRNKVDCIYLISMLNFQIPRYNSRQITYFKPISHRTNLGLKSPINTMCRNCNDLGNLCDIYADSMNKIINTAKNVFPSLKEI